LASIGSSLNAASVTAAAPTSSIVAAAADEVSEAVAALFSGNAQEFQALSVQAADFHQRLVQTLNASAASYGAAEAANAAAAATPLRAEQQQILGTINTPTELLLQRPLIGDGTNGAAGTGQNGGAGGTGGLLLGLNGNNGPNGA
jgi:PE family